MSIFRKYSLLYHILAQKYILFYWKKNGIVKRYDYKEMPPKVEYSLTEYGKTFIDIIYAMCNWGKENIKMRQENGEDIIINSIRKKL